MNATPRQLDLRLDPRITGADEIEARLLRVERLLRALRWKEDLDDGFPIIVGLIGGTGTGKSTLFNSLAGSRISRVGVKRPCTYGPVIYLHESFRDGLSRSPMLEPPDNDNPNGPFGGSAVVTHTDPRMIGVVLVDSPDFDSVESANRIIADNIFILADILIFVASQEKYGDMSGYQMRELARLLHKERYFVLNKVTSDTAYQDFRTALAKLGEDVNRLVRVDRVAGLPEIIADADEKSGLRALLNGTIGAGSPAGTRMRELKRLAAGTVSALSDLETALKAQSVRVGFVNGTIEALRESVSRTMMKEIDSTLSDTTKAHVEERLKELLRKYDFFFVPRMMIRDFFKRTIGTVFDMFGNGGAGDATKDTLAEDVRAVQAAAKIRPLESAVIELNRGVADILASDPALDDLRRIVRSDVPTWGPTEAADRFNDMFPGVGPILEQEFARFREGLSGTDEIKLYGAYTVSALILLTVEIAVGGGFGLFDVLLNAVIVPFIPRWLIDMKVVDLLRDIAERVDHQYRSALAGILQSRADLYAGALKKALPDDYGTKRLNAMKKDLMRLYPGEAG
ncbi:MAG: GTPase [Pseudomonadota bacterium]